MKKIINSIILTFTLTALFLTACGSAPTSNSGGLRVLATETFLGDIAQNVAAQRLQVETLLPVTTDPHEYQPRPQDVIKMTDSQVLIVNGLGYETWLKSTMDNLQGERIVVVASNGLTPNVDPSGEHPDGDPHMWMYPLNVIHYVENIRDGLTQADPAGKDIYAANADAYISKLKELDQWIQSSVAQLPQEKRLLVTNHDALGYFAQAYGFKVVGAVIPSITTDASPSAQQMAGLIDTIKSTGAPAIFLDIGENQNLAKQIASSTGAKVVTDLYVESISAPDGPAPTYLEMIKHDVSIIVEELK
jgi:zinc/manganese transport system substrate-binding protein